MTKIIAKMGGRWEGTVHKFTGTFREAILLASRTSAGMKRSKLVRYLFRGED